MKNDKEFLIDKIDKISLLRKEEDAIIREILEAIKPENMSSKELEDATMKCSECPYWDNCRYTCLLGACFG